MHKVILYSTLIVMVSALSSCMKTPVPPAEAAAAQTNDKALPFSIITDTGYEIDLRGFQYQRQYADCGYLIKQQGATVEIYRVEFTDENGGNYTYESRLPDGTVVGKSSRAFLVSWRCMTIIQPASNPALASPSGLDQRRIGAEDENIVFIRFYRKKFTLANYSIKNGCRRKKDCLIEQSRRLHSS